MKHNLAAAGTAPKGFLQNSLRESNTKGSRMGETSESRNQLIFRENGRRVLPVKVSVDNVHSGGGQSRAGIALSNTKANGDLRLIVGCEGYEHAVIHGAADLGGTGFRTGGDHAVLEGDPATEPPLVV